MKQMKFFLATLLAAMSLSLTSCMNGDNNTQVTDYPMLGIVKDNFMGFSFTGVDGYTYVSKNMPDNALSFQTGEYITALCSYDTSTDVDNTKYTVNIAVGLVASSDNNQVIGTTNEVDESEDSPYKSNRGVCPITSIYAPYQINNTDLLLTIPFYVKEDVSKHTFSLVYYTDSSAMTGNILTLYLRHTSTETIEEETSVATHPLYSYKVFRIGSAVQAFKTATGSYPTKITIVTEANTTDAKVPTSTTDVSMDYKYTEPNS